MLKRVLLAEDEPNIVEPLTFLLERAGLWAATRYGLALVLGRLDRAPGFTGVLGNYLKPSVAAAGLDPEDLPDEAVQMNFESGSSKPKAWKDIWSAGQGVGAVTEIRGAAAYVAHLKQEYDAARARLGLGPSGVPAAAQ